MTWKLTNQPPENTILLFSVKHLSECLETWVTGEWL